MSGRFAMEAPDVSLIAIGVRALVGCTELTATVLGWRHDRTTTKQTVVCKVAMTERDVNDASTRQ
jgi:hypothetical protein